MTAHSPPWWPATPWQWRYGDRTATGAAPVPTLVDDAGAPLVIASGGAICSPVRGPALARLIEDAPDLLKALAALVGPDHCACQPPCAHERARALIARHRPPAAPEGAEP